MRIGSAVVNKTQQLVLGFAALVWLTLAVILLLSPWIYDGSAGATGPERRLVDVGILVALSVPLALLGLAAVRRWRWAFWFILVAFFAGLLRVPAAALELSGHLATADPAWYVVLQAALGVVQFLIAIAMWIGYRRSGVWGAYRSGR